MAKVHATHSLGTADTFPVVASLPSKKRRPIMRLLFAGYATHGRGLDRAFYITRSNQSIKIGSNQVILLIDNGNR